jgi:hypothetical protein
MEKTSVDVDLATARVGSGHEEMVVGGRSKCGICGWIDEANEADEMVRKWHADSFEEGQEQG